jgi:hypothetical protein
MQRLTTMRFLVAALALVAANVVVFATVSLAFMWPVIGLVDAGSVARLSRARARR